MWTNENRGRYDRSKLRYPSDVTDEEWVLIAPLIPPAKRGGNKRTVIAVLSASVLAALIGVVLLWSAETPSEDERQTSEDEARLVTQLAT